MNKTSTMLGAKGNPKAIGHAHFGAVVGIRGGGWTLRRRIMAILRLSCMALGVSRKRLGMGQLGIGGGRIAILPGSAAAASTAPASQRAGQSGLTRGLLMGGLVPVLALASAAPAAAQSQVVVKGEGSGIALCPNGATNAGAAGVGTPMPACTTPGQEASVRIGNSETGAAIGANQRAVLIGDAAGQYVTAADAIAIGTNAGGGNGPVPYVGTAAISIGANSAANGASSVALGDGASAAADNGIALGTNTQVAVAGGVALGSGSVASTAAGVAGFVPAAASGAQAAAVHATTSTLAAVSVGDAANGEFRQITGVAAGTADSDAVNVAQLKAVQATASAGWNISAQGANTSTVAPGTAVDLRNSDGNIVVSKSSNSNDVTFNLAKDITVDNITVNQGANIANTLNVTNNSVTIAGGTNINMGGNTINNVANATQNNQAVNLGQLNAVISSTHLGFSGNEGATVTRNNGQVLAIRGGATTAGTYSDINMKTVTNAQTGTVTLQIADSPKFGNVVINDGATGKITGVTAATLSETSKDAVNGSQLVALGNSMADALSPSSSYNPATNAISTSISVGGTTYTNVEAAIQFAGQGWNVATAAIGSGTVTGSSVTNVAPGATATFTAGNNIAITQAGRDVQVALNPNIKVDSVGIAGGPTLNGDGIDMGGDKITNVGAGIAATDAVNLGQLQAGLGDAYTYVDKWVTALSFDLSRFRRDANGGTASAMAVSQVPQAFEPGMGITGVGVSTWQGEQAVAFGISKASDNGRVIIKATGTYNTRHQGGGAVGMGFQF